MSVLFWNDEDFSVQIPAIDNEHKFLLSLVNEFELSLTIDFNVHSHLIAEKLAMLSKCIKSHFESEERFLLLNSYPLFDEHHHEHARLLEQLNRFELRFRAEKKAFNEKMLLFLKDWLIRHILLHDRRFGYYFRDEELV